MGIQEKKICFYLGQTIILLSHNIIALELCLAFYHKLLQYFDTLAAITLFHRIKLQLQEALCYNKSTYLTYLLFRLLLASILIMRHIRFYHSD